MNKEQEIKELEERLAKLKEALDNSWPKKLIVYLHGDKEYNWNKGEELGLSEEAIKTNFKYALYEVEVELEVNEDGTYRIVSFKD